jgi:hypothetical protein
MAEATETKRGQGAPDNNEPLALRRCLYSGKKKQKKFRNRYEKTPKNKEQRVSSCPSARGRKNAASEHIKRTYRQAATALEKSRVQPAKIPNELVGKASPPSI